LFARHPADVLLLEVGLGGRLDATNVVDHPLATVITPVSLDHAEHLGDTVGKVAAEKAGILKPQVPAIVAAQPREALLAIERQAARVKAPIDAGRTDRDRGARPSVRTTRAARSAGAEAVRAPPVRECRRRHRRRVRSMGLASGRRLRPASPRRIGRRACSGSSQGRLATLVLPGSELWLDGGHNADGGRAIASARRSRERVPRSCS
jgi:dihydrofolate synthase/folylpolyglutamate synthase